MSNTRPRRPVDVPTGGQFATKTRTEPGYTLDNDEVAPAFHPRPTIDLDEVECCDECEAEAPDGRSGRAAPTSSVFAPLPDGPYQIVYADPPWSYYGSATKDAAAGKHYGLVGLDELAKLPVLDIMDRSAALFCWATGPRLDMAIEAIRRWGLHYRGVAFVWVKCRADGGIISGQGVPPTFTKPTTELVLAATTRPRGRAWPLFDLRQSQVILAPRREHSRKPDEIRQAIDSLAGPGPRRIELFARQRHPGWDAWGDQA